ncbi:ribosomal RNA-processing protein 8 [Heteronotia binoei]|uniref:ribosomal RNA-processing protein 8 n=1 Tax=Heteronotia binoei TaxID=13085 RepID=UPI00292CCF9E|nr:ribosomal RNA-processing protein 8 [Heteronotia binoei]
MFAEAAWSDAEAPAAPSAPCPRPRPLPRRALLAVLRRLQAAARPSPSRPEPALAEEGDRGGPAEGRAGAPSDTASLSPPGEAAAGAGPVPGDKRKNTPAEEEEEEEKPKQLLTRKQWRNRQKNKRRQKNKFKVGRDALALPLEASPPPQEPLDRRAAALRLQVEERLDSARFRYINQQLYTRPSREAARLFQEDPEAFAIYHRGFAQQVARWPENPVQRFVRYLRKRPASLVVADFGCGDCTLARSIQNKVHCFDLVALDPRVIICDMSQVPLEAESVDVVVFCLALMGTNLCEILEEANRVLRTGGTLLVAEVASRFADLRAFLGALSRLGFQLISKDVSGSHFYALELRKTSGARTGKAPAGLALLPCLYKRR